MGNTGQEQQQGPLVGRWEKVTTDPSAEKYPHGVVFATGTYRGTRGPGQGMVWWDAGIYRIEGPQTLLLSVATDELVTYRLDLRPDRFEVTDPDGCRFAYRRVVP